jgi:hypothetical protein
MITVLLYAGYSVAYLLIGLLGGWAVHTIQWVMIKRRLLRGTYHYGGCACGNRKLSDGEVAYNSSTSTPNGLVSSVSANSPEVKRRQAAKVIWNQHLDRTTFWAILVLLFWPVILFGGISAAIVVCAAIVVVFSVYYVGKGIGKAIAWAFGPGAILMVRTIDRFWLSRVHRDLRKAPRVDKLGKLPVNQVSKVEVKTEAKVLSGEIIK